MCVCEGRRAFQYFINLPECKDTWIETYVDKDDSFHNLRLEENINVSVFKKKAEEKLGNFFLLTYTKKISFP